MTLALRDVSFTYPGYPATLRGVTLSVSRGQSGFLLGPSGCGKSTLLRCIAGLEAGYGGEVLLEERALEGLRPHERHVGILFQEPALFPHLDVAGNVAFGMRYVGIPRSREREETMNWLDLVGLSGKASARVDELSGGERQRVALVRTLAAKPLAVLLDEPFSALDRGLRDDLGPKIKALLGKARVTALWVTHDEEEARRLADKTWALEEGRAVEVSL